MIVSLNELNLQRSGAVFFGVVDCDRKNDGKENNQDVDYNFTILIGGVICQICWNTSEENQKDLC